VLENLGKKSSLVDFVFVFVFVVFDLLLQQRIDREGTFNCPLSPFNRKKSISINFSLQQAM
jgi:hypothetical protein